MEATPDLVAISFTGIMIDIHYGRFIVQLSLKSRWLGLLALCLMLFTASVSAQSVSGELVGTIYDPTGATIPGASVVAANVATGVQSSAVSSSTGQYRLGNLAAGVYALKVSATGFTGAELKGVQVTLNMQSTTNVTLQVGESKTTVEVSGAAVTIDTTTAQVQGTFESKQLADLPVTSSGSGVLNLALYTSGVSSSGGVGVGSGPSVGGQRPRNNNFTIEGIDNNSKSVTGPMATIPNDAVQEFSILANQFSAQYGHSSGGQFNQVLKGGTNEFHGMGYEYMNNRTLNAIDQQSIVSGVTEKARYDNNRFGGNIGGPIKKNKLFFFFDYEYNPVGQAGVPGAIYAPTTEGYSMLAGIPGINQTNLGILKQYVPAQSTALAGTFATICPGVQLGADKTAGNCPAGTPGMVNIPLGQYSFTAPGYTNNYTYLTSVDYSLSDKDQIHGRYVRNNSTTQDTSAQLPQFWMPEIFPNYLATLTEYHNFSPNVNNEFRLGFNRNSQVWPVGNQKFPGLDQFPNLQFFDLNGVQIGADPNAPQEAIQNTYQVTDNVSWMKGAHTITAGVDLKKFISPQTFTQRGRGDYEYNYVSDYLMDYVPDYLAERTTGNFVYYGDQIQFGAFVNDSWKLRPNFTINLGVRYERTTLPYGERLQTVNAISNVPGLITFGEPKPANLNFEPRIGFAWSPGTSGKTSIRGGFGINYDQLFDNLGILSAAPQFQQTVDSDYNAGTTNYLANGGIKPTASSGTMDQATARAYTGGYIPDQKLPKSVQWNIGIQRVVHEDYTVELRYLGTRGLNLPIQDRLNVMSAVDPQHSLPMYLSMPSQGTLDGLTNTLGSISARGHFLPQYADAGFQSSITAYMPMGASTYHGLAAQVTRRFSNGLQFVGSYTFSHNIDNSTAEVFSTYTTPRRQQDFQNLNAERSSSALDHRNRFTMATVYDMPFFKGGNWFMKNLVGNWELAPIYTYETGTLATIQSGVDSNLNGDAVDRAWVNPAGTSTAGSTTTALKNSNGDVVGYLVNNPSARYVATPKGVLPTAGRNTAHMRPIDNIDFSLLKRFNVFKEGYKLEVGARFMNLLNHAQYTGSRINDIAPILTNTSGQVHNYLIPGATNFYDPTQVFSSNPRTIQVTAKFIF
jgi:hypothetical protein